MMIFFEIVFAVVLIIGIFNEDKLIGVERKLLKKIFKPKSHVRF